MVCSFFVCCFFCAERVFERNESFTFIYTMLVDQMIYLVYVCSHSTKYFVALVRSTSRFRYLYLCISTGTSTEAH